MSETRGYATGPPADAEAAAHGVDVVVVLMFELIYKSDLLCEKHFT